VKRANRTHTEEFDAITKAEPELEAFQAELLAWERVYNATGPTRPWATSFPPDTSSRWGSMCNERTEPVHALALTTTFGYGSWERKEVMCSDRQYA